MKLLNEYIDHTLLKPEASQADIEKVCSEAIQHQFYGVCIDRKWLKEMAPKLKAANVKAVTVVGFPAGDESTSMKVEQVLEAVASGADEIDMVLNRTLLKAKNYTEVLQDIQSVVKAAQGRVVKVILETSELTDDEKIAACVLSVAAGASYVKTSTGFASGGATVEDVRLMRQTVGYQIGVKASGGIRNRQAALEMVAAGATRLGTSSSISIVDCQASAESTGY